MVPMLLSLMRLCAHKIRRDTYNHQHIQTTRNTARTIDHAASRLFRIWASLSAKSATPNQPHAHRSPHSVQCDALQLYATNESPRPTRVTRPWMVAKRDMRRPLVLKRAILKIKPTRCRVDYALIFWCWCARAHLFRKSCENRQFLRSRARLRRTGHIVARSCVVCVSSRWARAHTHHRLMLVDKSFCIAIVSCSSSSSGSRTHITSNNIVV